MTDSGLPHDPTRPLASIRRCALGVLLLLGPAPGEDVHAAEQLSQSSAEAAIARLSDQEVRRLLIEQLAPAGTAARSGDEEFNPAVIMYRLQRGIGTLSQELDAIFAAVDELPDVFPRAWASFTADREQGGLAWFVVALVVSMGAGGVAAYLVRARVRTAVGEVSVDEPKALGGKVAVLLSGLLVHSVYVVAFCALSAGVFVLFFDESPKDRIAFFFYLAASAIFLISIAASIAFFSPYRPGQRLSLYTDSEARSLHRCALITIGFGAFGFFTCALVGTLGVLGEVHQLFLILVGTVTSALLIHTIVSNGSAISRDIASDAPRDSVRAISARVWPWAFATIVAAMLVGLVVRELLYDFVPYGAVLFTVALMAVTPSLDAALFREEARLTGGGEGIKGALMRGIRLGLIVVVVVSLSVAWKLNPFVAGDGGIGARIASISLQVTLTLLVAYGAWQLVRIAIDQKIAEEDELLAAQGIDVAESEIGGTGLSRMRTLLPLFKRTLQISLFVMAIMIVLASVGVDIAPLLAGAGVVGLAIGFGSQTLVRDIVSGAFFLLDDAFRIGEYIDVGSVKGSVEKMSVRSVRLRHHRGAVHTVPYGEIKTLTNYSRDWAIMKLRFRVPFDTDLNKVRKLLKATGQELAQVDEIKDDFIQPFKAQGAMEADDYGFVISTKFMSKPGKQYVIRRYVFAAVQKAFEANGIQFATPRVGVQVEANQDLNEADGTERTRPGRTDSAAGAAAIEVVESAKPAV